MTPLIEFLGAITVEQVKAVAAVLQAVGFIGAAWMAYRLAKKLEEHKYKIRRDEIMFSKFHEKRLATLEFISALQGKVLYETSELLFFGGFKETVPQNEGENRETYMKRTFEPRHKDISAALFEMRQAQEAGIVYLPDLIYISLSNFHKAIVELVETYTLRMQEPRHESEFYKKLIDDAIARFRELESERLQLVNQVRAYLEREGVVQSSPNQTNPTVIHCG